MCNPFDNADWTDESLKKTWDIVRDIAVNEFKLDFYRPSFEVVTFEEMLHIYTTSFPIMYNHWTYGKDYEDLYRQYKNNRTSIAYEVIFNTNPALCYLEENNTSVMQALVMAHAAIGHSSFFKMNEFLRENTNANTIIPFMKKFRSFVAECDVKYGSNRVSKILDVCKTFSLYAVDKAEKPKFTNKQREQRRQNRAENLEKDFDILVAETRPMTDTTSKENNENILKFIAAYGFHLKAWERNLIEMFCKVEQYFYPQRLTKMMNEGFASFWHYQIMNRMYDLGHLKEGDFMEFLHSHTSVLCQRDFDEPGYGGLNPYKIGFEIFNDIKRICTDPTDEDKQYFPNLIGKDWIDEVNYAAVNFRDSSFIQQYLSPKLVRDFKFLMFQDDSLKDYYEIKFTHCDDDFKNIRTTLINKFNLYNHIPYMAVEGAALKGDRTLFICIKDVGTETPNFEELEKSFLALRLIWPYPIKLKYFAAGQEESETIKIREG